MLGQFLILFVSLALLAPWSILGVKLLPHGTVSERLAVGAAGGLAATVTCAHLLGVVHRLAAYGWVFAGVCAAAALASWRGRTTASSATTPDEGARWFWLGVALVTGFELIPTLASAAPIGWDPAFHAILAEKVRRAGGLIYDWQPFESIALNYPLGSHLWVALVASAARQPVHCVFQVQHLIIQTLTSALLFVLAARVLGCWRSALFAMLSYGLLGDWGTFYSYYQWGGLPTEMGFLLFLALIWSALALRGWGQTALGALLYGSLVLIHHLSAAIATLVLAGYVVLAAALRTRDGLWQRFTATALSAALAYAWFIVPYALRASRLQHTEALHFSEEHRLSLITLVDNLGVFVVAAGAFGLWRMRALPGAGVTFVFAWSTMLLGGYFGLDYVYRLVALLTSGNDYTAFTASRLATVLSYPLCIAAGFGMESLRAQWFAWRAARSHPAPRPSEHAGLAILVLGAALIAVPRGVTLSRRHAFAPKAEQLGTWLQAHTPENAFIVYHDPIGPRRWVPYLTWRAGPYTPVPASEDRAAVERKYAELFDRREQLAQQLARYGKQPWLFSLSAQGTPKLEPMP